MNSLFSEKRQDALLKLGVGWGGEAVCGTVRCPEKLGHISKTSNQEFIVISILLSWRCGYAMFLQVG